ncbi:MAG: hypothetical protein M3O33_00575 [Cyanobacteriota bacterium]|nr:hypothetical protein [Cyanobacteriota bacterium]
MSRNITQNLLSDSKTLLPETDCVGGLFVNRETAKYSNKFINIQGFGEPQAKPT